MNRRLRNAIAGLITPLRVAVMVTLVVSATSLALGTATAHAAVKPRPVIPPPTSIYTPQGADLIITNATWNSVTIHNDGPLATRDFHVYISWGERRGDPLWCTKTTLLDHIILDVPGGLGPYGSVTLPIAWATNTRYVIVDPHQDYLESIYAPGNVVSERRPDGERNNRGTIPARDNPPGQCVLSP